MPIGKRRKPIQPTRGPYDPDRKPGPGPVPPEQYGQQQTGPGWQSGGSMWLDMLGGNYGEEFSPNWTNMQDVYDFWQEFHESGIGGDNFQDWFNNQGQLNPYGSDALWDLSGFSGDPIYGGNMGGSIGGQGDLGTGNVFIGGGMGNIAAGGEMYGQDCATLGPQFNSAGECIACCESQYAGTGFYGDPDYDPGGGGAIDPDIDMDCYDQYMAMQDTIGSDIDFGEFSGLYC